MRRRTVAARTKRRHHSDQYFSRLVRTLEFWR